MGKVPVDLRKNIATNIRNCRHRKYPQWGGAKQCALAFGVTPQQWSQWERGAHMPDEFRMIRLAEFFGVSIEWLRRNNAGETGDKADNTATDRTARKPERQETFVRATPSGFGAVRIDDGVEVPLRIEVEVERLVYQSNYVVKMERLL